MKTLVASLFLILLVEGCFAETCPDIKAIKKNTMVGWKAYDSDDGTPISPEREAKFKKMLQQFALAEWKQDKNLMNSMHCYYRDKTGSNLEAYLAKENFIPKKNRKNFWYQVSGSMHCAAGKEKCQFESHPMLKQQLAKR